MFYLSVFRVATDRKISNIARLTRMVCLEDIRFILVRAECPYVQFVAAARVISTKKFTVGVTNGRERDMSQVSNGRNERVPRARLLLSCVLVL